jgi:choline dehydrogenase-like flavoprotein
VSEVIVIGGGIAGICAALELLDAGRRVLLLERDTEDNFGGLAKESFGGIFLVGTPEQRRAGIRDTPELALADWHAFGDWTRMTRPTAGPAPGPKPMCSAATMKSASGCASAASASCPRRTGSSAASTRPATRCRASTSSGAPGGNWRCA